MNILQATEAMRAGHLITRPRMTFTNSAFYLLKESNKHFLYERSIVDHDAEPSPAVMDYDDLKATDWRKVDALAA